MSLIYGKGFFPKVCGPNDLVLIDGDDVRFNVPDRTPAAIRQSIRDFAEFLFSLDGHTVDFDVTHTLIDGVYTRTLFIPKGMFLVGKVHLKECVNIVAKGDISILTETGMGRIQAGHIAVSKPGIQKLGYAHEDTVFVNVFRTDETDITKIEAEIATADYEAIEANKQEMLCR
jgi:hypothetical protein